MPWLSRVRTFLLCAAGILVNGLLLGPGALRSGYEGRNDFRVFYLGGKLAGGPGLYDPDRVRAAQQEIFGETNPRLPPTRLPFYYALLSPLGRLSFRAAAWLWTGGLILAAALGVALWPGLNRTVFAIACCWSFPLIYSIAEGQDLAFLLLILAGTLKIFHGRRPFLAGALLSFCLIKFHLLLLLPLLILQKREWRLGAGLFSGTFLLLSGSFLAAGWWPRVYAATILSREANPDVGIMPNLHGLAANFGAASAVELILSLLVLVLAYVAIRRQPFEPALAATLLGSLLLSRHSSLYDCALLIPGLLTIVRAHENFLAEAFSLVLLIPLPYQYFFISEQGAIMAVPILLALAGVALGERLRPGHAV